jgi:anti-sigma factor ChrR (cupin superfamily)
VSADIAAVEAQTDDIGVAGAGLTAIPWNASWDAEVQSEVADALEVTIADSIPADGTIPSVKQALYMLTQFMLERSVATTTVTVKKADGSTTLFTLTLDDATTPTSITRAT